MTYFIVGFWCGVSACYGVTWLSTHPADRSALFSRVKGWFSRNNGP
jgi:hypothetical protein